MKQEIKGNGLNKLYSEKILRIKQEEWKIGTKGVTDGGRGFKKGV